ncbi:MAG: putative ghmp kinase [Ramlibacter sp.]|nr:putative ghmp kinase [Ramlibacter sp.]
MIIIRTPLRISFFGGGTDFPEFFSEHGGAVLGTSIDKYIYHTVSHLPSWLFDHKIRFSYRKVELVRELDDLEHKPFREILRHCGVLKDVEVNLASDLPSFSGLGSSSSFTAGLIKGLHALQGRTIGSEELARAAIHVERDVLQETVGLQDQVFAAYGGFNLIRFNGKSNFNVERIVLGEKRMAELNDSLMLFFTGLTRQAQDVERRKLDKIEANQGSLKNMLALVDRACDALVGTDNLSVFGQLLHETWMEKRKLDSAVSAPEIDKIYEAGRSAGALGGKLLGAGGGGFMLLFVPVEKQAAVRLALRGYHEVPFRINAAGSTVLHS